MFLLAIVFLSIFVDYLKGKETFSPFGPLLCHRYCCETGGCSDATIDQAHLVCNLVFDGSLLTEQSWELFRRTCGGKLCPRRTGYVDTRTGPRCVSTAVKSGDDPQEQKSGLKAIVMERTTMRSSSIKSKDMISGIWRSIHELDDPRSQIKFLRVFGYRVVWCQENPFMCSFADLDPDSLDVNTIKDNLPVPGNVLNIEADSTCSDQFAALAPNIIQPLNTTYHPTGPAISVKGPVHLMAYFPPQRLLCVEVLMDGAVFCAVYNNGWKTKKRCKVKKILHLSFYPYDAVLLITQRNSKKVLLISQPGRRNMHVSNRVYLHLPGLPLSVYPYKQQYIVILKRKVVITDRQGKLQQESYTLMSNRNIAPVFVG